MSVDETPIAVSRDDAQAAIIALAELRGIAMGSNWTDEQRIFITTKVDLALLAFGADVMHEVVGLAEIAVSWEEMPWGAA